MNPALLLSPDSQLALQQVVERWHEDAADIGRALPPLDDIARAHYAGQLGNKLIMAAAEAMLASPDAIYKGTAWWAFDRREMNEHERAAHIAIVTAQLASF